MAQIEQVDTPDQVAAVRDLMNEYLEWTKTIELDAWNAPTFHGIDRELAALPGPYAPPGGRLLVAVHDGKAAGCVALKPVNDEIVELKRLYVRPEFRGHRIGEQLVDAIMAEARNIGYARVILDSHISMTKAHALYRAAGFRLVTAPDDFPEWLKPVVVFMECPLD
jgi:GNAT superfamily N-acetyltransferase